MLGDRGDLPSALTKARFEELAKTWTRLATDLEQAKALVDQWGVPDTKKTA
jgi:hypothetical protein